VNIYIKKPKNMVNIINIINLLLTLIIHFVLTL